MSEKFTPGPWRLNEIDIDMVVYAEGHKLGGQPVIAFASVSDDDYGHYGVEDASEELANAHLIAAAPEMYEALKNVCICCDRYKQDCDQCAVGRVLRKARGGQ